MKKIAAIFALAFAFTTGMAAVTVNCHRLIQAALADNERREIVRNREARHALALSVAGASAVIVFWLATLLFY